MGKKAWCPRAQANEDSDKYTSLGPAGYRKGVYGVIFHQGAPPPSMFW